MSHDDVERAIEFLLGHQAQLSADVQSLTNAVRLLTNDVQTLARTVQTQSDEVSSIRQEMREGFNNLILANEVTRELTSQIGKLAHNTSQRVTKLEQDYQTDPE
ncbi:MAG TPA: hypothetical protein VI756_28400 [Blastocatellia bacterium]